MATIVLYERKRTIFAGSVKNRNTRPLLLFLFTNNARTDRTVQLVSAWANTRDELLDEALGLPKSSTGCQLFSQRDLG